MQAKAGKEETEERATKKQRLEELAGESERLAAELRGYDENSAEFIEILLKEIKVSEKCCRVLGSPRLT